VYHPVPGRWPEVKVKHMVGSLKGPREEKSTSRSLEASPKKRNRRAETSAKQDIAKVRHRLRKDIEPQRFEAVAKKGGFKAIGSSTSRG